MGTMTLDNFESDLVSALGRGSISDTLLDRWINATYVEIAHGFKFREFEARTSGPFVEGIGTITPPADFRAFHEDGLWITSPADRVGRMIPETRDRYMRNVDQISTGSYGIGKYFHIFGELIYIRPYPDSVATNYELHYWKKATRLSLGTDVTVLDDDWDDIIFTGALWRGHRHFGEHGMYFNVRNDYISAIRTRQDKADLEPFPEGGISLARGTDAEEDYQRG